MSESPRILGLLDDKAGHANQVRGLIDALKEPAKFIPLRYNRYAALPNILLGATLCHLHPDCRKALKDKPPLLLIACGRRTEPVARFIKYHHPATRIVYLMRPASGKDWDAILIPTHDRPKKNDPRIIETALPLHRVSHAALEQARIDYHSRFAHFPSPRIGVLVGDMADSTACLHAIENLAGSQGSVLVSTSRRTSAQITQALKKSLRHPHIFYDAHATSHTDNPYLGILAYADMLIVSGDSLSMCAEAAATNAPLFIDDTDKNLSQKHRAMHQALYAQGRAKSLKEPAQAFAVTYENPHETEKIAAHLRERFLL